MSRLIAPPSDEMLRELGVDQAEHAYVIQLINELARGHGGFLDEATLNSHGYNLADDTTAFIWIPELGAPAFQFDPNGRLYKVVETVNAEANAIEEPYGPATWWLEGGEACPIHMIGRVCDEELIQFARDHLA